MFWSSFSVDVCIELCLQHSSKDTSACPPCCLNNSEENREDLVQSHNSFKTDMCCGQNKPMYVQGQNTFECVKKKASKTNYLFVKTTRNNKKQHWVITCLPSAVSKPKNFSSQSPSRGRPSSHNSPFTLQTSAPLALWKQSFLILYLTNKHTNSWSHVMMPLPDTLRNKERSGDTGCSLYGPPILELDSDGQLLTFKVLVTALFFSQGLKYPQPLR